MKALSPGWGAWDTDLTVEVERDSKTSLLTTYAVFVDGDHVGYVASRKEGNVTMWDHSLTKFGGGYYVFGSPSRRDAVGALIEARWRR